MLKTLRNTAALLEPVTGPVHSCKATFSSPSLLPLHEVALRNGSPHLRVGDPIIQLEEGGEHLHARSPTMQTGLPVRHVNRRKLFDCPY